ncbi:autotransporter outer membrane beta-barrel domain-containing protein [Loktanella sp. 5RATIMAR09]|uniref:autotransporter outer membrane beta-barrel domain-containing protein n=1 Tax=Loktanella sp. 5RATIMAR09 TaxID=1225655 RepID=UPI0006EB8EA3|nr:autotransporter outer membrane beta-barrel domain-containing protein [Loktanella sp. 5RATIMAR09]
MTEKQYSNGKTSAFLRGGHLTKVKGVVASCAPCIGFALATTVILPDIALSQSLEWDGAGATVNGTVEGGSGTWDAATTNWTTDGGATNEAWTPGGDATFGGTAGTVTVQGLQEVSNITFNTDGYVLNGVSTQNDQIRLVAGAGEIAVNTGTATLNVSIEDAGVADSDLIKTGGGTLVLDGFGLYRGDTAVQEGTLQLTNSSAISNTSGTVQLDAGAKLQVSASNNINGFAGFGETEIDAGRTLSTGFNGSSSVYGGVISGAGNLRSFSDLTLSGDSTYTGVTTVAGEQVTLTGSLASTDIRILANANFPASLNIAGDGDAINDAAIISNAGTLILTGNDETVGAVFGTGNINLNNILTFGDATDREISGVVSGSGVMNYRGAAELTLSGNSTMTGLIGNSGGGTIAFSGSTTGGVSNLSGDFENTGTIGGNVTVSDGTFTNGTPADPGTIGGTVQLIANTAQFDNNQNSAVNGTLTMDDGTVNANGGTFADVVLIGGIMNINADTVATSVTSGGQIDIDTGTNLTATLEMTGGSINNDGTMTGPATVTNGTFHNGDNSGIPAGTVAGDVLINGSGGTFNNYSASDVTGTFTIDDDDGNPATGGTLNGFGGSFGDVVVNDGTFNMRASTTADNLTNGGGDVLIEAGGVTLLTNFNQTGGETRVASGGTLTDTNGLLEISGGELQNNGGGTVTSDIAVSGGALTASGGSFGGNVAVSGTGTFNVDGSSAIGTTTMTGGIIDISTLNTLLTDLVQSGGTTTVNFGGTLDDTDGTVALTGGTLINEGTVSDDITLTNDAALVADGGTFDGAVTLSGVDTVFDVNASTTINPTLTVSDGTVNINGAAVLTTDLDLGDGTVNVGTTATFSDADGILLDSGTLNNAGMVNGLVTVENGGALEMSGGAFSDGVLANGGNILISGDTSVDLTNNGSDIALASGLTLTDDVVNNSGTFTSAGTIDGELQITGGTFTQTQANTGDPTSGVTGAVTVTGGLLVAGSGDFTSGITAETNGQIEIGGMVTGNVTNDGGNVTVASDGDLTGNLTNSGTAQSTGTISGDVANTGTLELAGILTGSLVNDGAGTVTTTGTTSGITTLNQNATGLITVSDGDTLSAQTITVASGSDGVSIGAGATLEGLGNSLTNGATITLGAGGVLRDAGSITNQTGATMLFDAGGVLIGDNDSSGDEDILNDGNIAVGGGTLNVSLGGAGVFSNAGLLALDSGSSVIIGGHFASTGTGTSNMQNGTTGETVTVNGDYSGGGTLAIDVDFTGDTADRFIINGDVTGGATTVVVSDVSAGSISGNDIIVASVSGTAAEDAFVLATPLSFGAINYDIAQVGGDFVLGAYGGFVAEVVGLEALATSLLMQSDLPSLNKRAGFAMTGENSAFGQTRGAWFMIDAGSSGFAPSASGTAYRGEMEETRFRGGMNLDLMQSDAGLLVVGANLSWGTAETDLLSDTGAASISTDALSGGLSATWYGNTGFYIDGQVQYNVFDSTVISGGTESSTDGTGYASALEIGKWISLNGTGWNLNPRGQVSHTVVAFDDFTSGGGLDTSLDSAESLQVGLGLNAESAADSVGQGFTFYGSAMVSRELVDDITTIVAGTPVISEAEDWTGEMGLGVRHGFGNGRGSLYGEASYSAGFDNPGDNNSLSVMLGGQVSF